ncbi:SDR family NAD(P)-dependent oxidoreductase [Mycobacterium syngnathidarum]
MTDETGQFRDYLKRASREVQVLRERLAEADDRAHEPIAIVGIGCRFPQGVRSPEELWDLVASGTDAIGEFPEDRGWDTDGLFDQRPDAPGKTYQRTGAFLSEATEFDARFFDISPREAIAMDPNQRALLETSWEAIEHARIDPEKLRQSRTGVFVGITSLEYGDRMDEHTGAHGGYLYTGTASSVASGRIAYTLGLQGPAISIDTACSSSLTAMHLACQSLRLDECTLALAGGASIWPTPGIFIEFSRLRGLAQDGRCKAFSAAADGLGWGEGVGIVLLERLSDALANGHQVLAVIRGSAVNQDGASNGLTAPNGPAQERVIRQALTNSRLTAADIDTVEAHGTGTALGDPIEAGALLATYGQAHTTDQPLYLGSIKSNIGHTAAAAGVAGIIKMTMALKHKLLPQTLHIQTPSPHVDWTSGAIELLTNPQPWPQTDHPRRAAISAFGVSGTNAHLILEQPPEPETPNDEGQDTTTQSDDNAPQPVTLWPISAKTPSALRNQIARLHRFATDNPEIDLADIGLSLATTRSHFSHRTVVYGPAREHLIAAMHSVLERQPQTNTAHAVIPAAKPAKLAVVYSGQGTQYTGMCKELYQDFPCYARAFDEVCSALDAHLSIETPLRDIVLNEDRTTTQNLLEQTLYAQPALFAVQVAMHTLLASFGVTPDVLIGHSIGELTAAHLAGIWSLDDAATLVAARAQLMQSCPTGGSMLAVQATEHEVLPLVDGHEDHVTIAAINSPTALVISGDTDHIDRIADHFTSTIGRPHTRLQVSHAFHSPHMVSALEPLLDIASTLTYSLPTTDIQPSLSTDIPMTDPRYWAEQLRHPVRFHQAVNNVLRNGPHTFIELGPHPALVRAIDEILTEEPDISSGSTAIPTARRDHPDSLAIASSLAQLHAHGHELDWRAIYPKANKVPLPTYAFDPDRYWLDRSGSKTPPLDQGSHRTGHPILSSTIDLPNGAGFLMVGQINLTDQPWLGDHTVAGTVVLPGTAFLEMTLYAATTADCPYVAELTVQSPLALSKHSRIDLQLHVGPLIDGQDRMISIRTRSQTPEDTDTSEWTVHATARVQPNKDDSLSSPESWEPNGVPAVEAATIYASLTEIGYDYGPAFAGLQAAWRQDQHLYAKAQIPADLETTGYLIHPALLDAGMHCLALLDNGDDPDAVRLPFVFTGVTAAPRGGLQDLRIHIAITGKDTISATYVDHTGTPVLTIEKLSLRPVSRDQLRRLSLTSTVDDLLVTTWAGLADNNPSETTTTRWAMLSADTDFLAKFGDIPHYEDLPHLNAAMQSDTAQPQGVIWPIPDTDSTGLDDVPESIHALVNLTVQQIQQWLSYEWTADTRLVVLTRCAVSVSDSDQPHLFHGPLWGLLRSVQNEYPDRITLVDIDDHADSHTALLTAPVTTQHQLTIRAGQLHTAQLTHVPTGEFLTPPADSEWLLDNATPGTLSGLALQPSPNTEDPLQAGQVRIRARAMGVNFRDVAVALGMLPREHGFGGELAGVIEATGPEANRFAVGDRVMGLADNAFGPVVVSDERLLAPIPSTWSFAQACSVPVAFLTAYHALVDLANLQPGQTVLIHAAAGGVGQAALQLARHLGAEPFVTAHPDKWALLRELGCPDDHIANSRTLDFTPQFREVTHGRGIDVVLNSLSGPFVDASLQVLAPGGRFVEIGKTDIRDPRDVAIAYPDTTYHAFDLRANVSPDRTTQMLDELLTLFDVQTIEPLPIIAYDIRHATRALRLMQHAHHTGKIVLTLPRQLDPAGTVLISGGTGTLGGVLARHLVSNHGVRHLRLISRHGPDADDASRLQADLQQAGATVTIAKCDAADRNAVTELLASIPDDHPLTGVFHAAGVIADATITNLTPQDVTAALTPKVDAAWHLHELTRHLDLAEFVMYSSASGVLGTPGQANYAAANAFLDSLAQHRHRQGLAATSVAWGHWEPVSGLTENLTALDRTRLSRLGLAPISTEHGHSLLDHALTLPYAAVTALPLDQHSLNVNVRQGTCHPLLRALARRVPQRGGVVSPSATALDLRERLTSLDQSERQHYLLTLVNDCTTTILNLRTPISPDQPFRALGVDSLTALELRNQLIALTGLPLSATLPFDYPTPSTLASYLRESLLGTDENAVTDTRGRTTAAQARHSKRRTGVSSSAEPIAIIGAGCRLPGDVASAEQLLQLVLDREDAVIPIPEDRGWKLDDAFNADPDQLGTTYVRHGGFLQNAPEFDAGFFEIGPLEASTMDPQQRLLLEVSWEALEHARIDPTSLAGSDSGVFIGIYSTDYGSAATEAHHGYLITGTSTSVASGRLAYVLGLQGPAMTIDTACSSSLVAIHQACQSLRNQECSLTLAGGATVIGSPWSIFGFCRQRALAKDGRSKAFSAQADGMGLAEGAGVVVLERLSDAVANNHRVLAVIRGSAVNQDGASNGLTAPNGPSQEMVIRRALSDAGLSTDDIDVVEAHGTGTRLGDPIEAKALSATYGHHRSPDQPVWLGSVKSNIGHTGAAAGVTGVIKMVMALNRGVIPPTLHVEEPSSYIDWTGPLRLSTQAQPWVPQNRPRRAAVSSFGISGTNCHLVLEEPSPTASDKHNGSFTAAGNGPHDTAKTNTVSTPTVIWPLSAKTGAALRAQAARLHKHLDERPSADLGDIGYSLATTRAHLNYRSAIHGQSRHQLLNGLQALAQGRPHPNLYQATTAPVGLRKTVFVYPGHGGSVWHGMCSDLYGTSPTYRQALQEADQALRPFTGWSVIDVLDGNPRTPLLERDDVTEPILFAVMTALTRLWQSYGITPDAVVGYAQGEAAAAHIAGALSLDDAARIVTLRSKALQPLAEHNATITMALPAAETDQLLKNYDNRLTIVGIDSPATTVVGGDAEAVKILTAHCERSGVRIRQAAINYAGHSWHVDAIGDQIRQDLAAITAGPTHIPFYSTVDGHPHDAPIPGHRLDATYWWDNLRNPVRLQPTVHTLLERGYGNFLESSPHPVLAPALRESVENQQHHAVIVPTIRRGHDAAADFHTAMAAAYTCGLQPAWDAFYGTSRREVDLPTYAFDHRRYWLRPTNQQPIVESGGPELTTESDASASSDRLRASLVTMPEDQRRESLYALVCTHAATILGHTTSEVIDGRSTFKELGFDSLSAMGLTGSLQRATDLSLPGSVVFDYPTPAALAGHLYRQFVNDGSPTAPVIAELDRLSTTLTAVSPESPDATAITERLQSLVRSWSKNVDNLDGTPRLDLLSTATEDSDIDSADLDDLLRLSSAPNPPSSGRESSHD